jgi:phage protein D
MTIAQDARVAGFVAVRPSIYVGATGTKTAGTALTAQVERLVERVVVDGHLHLPDMFEITFFDHEATALAQAGLAVGVPVEIWSGSAETSGAQQLIAGEVTAIEGVYDTTANHTVVRGYSLDHRLQRARRTRTFLNMKDSDIARDVASAAGLTVGTIEETKATHDHVGQVNQTDWEFLTWRAAAIGHEIGMTGGQFYFRKAASTSSATGSPITLTFPVNLRTFAPRMTAGNIGQEAEVRVWDPLSAKVVNATLPSDTGSVRLTSDTPGDIAGLFSRAAAAQPPADNPALGDLGPDSSGTGFVSSYQPLASGAAVSAAADEAVAGVLEQVNSTFAEAEGEAIGDPHLLAGAVVTVSGVPSPFSGDWVVTTAKHVFAGGYYHTFFEVSGRHTRSLLGLASGGDRPAPALVHGVACGIVSNVNDPLGKARVKVTLPWLSPRFESDWGSVAQFGAGRRSGALFLPEVGDEVLVAFEFGDPRRPYVLGGIVNNNSTYQLGGPAIQAKGETADVVWRGFVSASGNRLSFHDQLPPGDGDPPPQASDLVLGTKDSSLALAIDQVAGTVLLSCRPAPPNSKAEAGQLTIQCGDTGVINITTGTGGTVNVDGGAQLNLKAQTAIKIESEGVVEIKGNPIKLN